jgi:hypothetical protein
MQWPDTGGLAALIEAASSAVSPEVVVALLVCGGAVGRVPAEATALAHRDTPLLAIAVAAGADAHGDVRRHALVDRFWGPCGRTPQAPTPTR